jgi:predicted amidophosphoribosyltransferase
MVRVPYWFPLVVFAAYPAARARSTRRAWTQRHRRAHGLCLNCGYDVRASTERCPECGDALLPARASPERSKGPDVFSLA